MAVSYNPLPPWIDGQLVVRNTDGVLFIYSKSLNALTINPNVSGSIKDAGNYVIQNLPLPRAGLAYLQDSVNRYYVDAHPIVAALLAIEQYDISAITGVVVVPSAWAIIGHAIAGAVSGTAGIDTTGADLLIICQNVYSATPNAADIIDSKGNIYTTASTITSTAGTSQGAAIFYCHSPTVGSGHTVRNAGSGNFGTIEFIALSGSVVSPLDVTGTSRTSSGITVAPGSVTPTQSGDFCLAFCSFDTGGSPTFSSVGSGFTLLEQLNTVSPGFGIVSAYLEQGVVAAVNPAFTRSAAITGQDLALIATFKSH